MIDQDSHPTFQDLLVWQRSMEFVNAVLDLTEKLETPQKHYRLIEQLESAVASVPMNIAEGKGRQSDKELIRFLYIARGSLYETMTLLTIFEMRNWITKDTYSSLVIQSNQIAKMIHGLIATIRNSKS